MATNIEHQKPFVKGKITASNIAGARPYEYITDRARALEVLSKLPDQVHALDFETTSLDPSEGKVRLTTICNESDLYILDHFHCGEFEDYALSLSSREWAVFNAGFEGDWIDYYSDSMRVQLYDVGIMRKAKLGGGPLSLAIMAKRDLKIDLVKDEQNSGWGNAVLTKSQLDYAAYDGDVTWQLWDKWTGELSDEQWDGFMVINEAWRGTKEMERTGLNLDVAYHAKLLQFWTLKRDTAERYLRRWTDKSVIANLRSNKQLSDFFKSQVLTAEAARAWPRTDDTKTDQLNMERDTLRQFAHRAPYPINRWVAALIIFKKMEKYISTYGQKLIDAQLKWGKVTSRFNIAQAITCRYSSSNFNLQNIPRSPVVRRSFVAQNIRLPTGREIKTIKVKLVMADYKAIEVRVLAEVSHDEALLYDAIYGDVHSRSACAIFKQEYDYFIEVLHGTIEVDGKKVPNPRYDNIRPVFKDYRSRAKAFTFQLLYGAGAGALAIALRCSDEEAYAAIDAWARTYPKAFHYRTIMFEHMNHSGYLPVCDGRTIFVFRGDRTMPVAANYPIQGAAASVMYRAVCHVHRALREQEVRCNVAASVHDELLLKSWEEDAEIAQDCLVDGMTKAWLDIFPGTNTDNLLEAVIGDSWAEKA